MKQQIIQEMKPALNTRDYWKAQHTERYNHVKQNNRDD